MSQFSSAFRHVRVRTSSLAAIALGLFAGASLDAAFNGTAEAALKMHPASGHEQVVAPVARSVSGEVRVAQSSNNPIAAFFSIFAKKKKQAPARVIVVPPNGGLQGGGSNGQRIFNPFIGNSAKPGADAAKPKPRTIGRRTMCVRLCDGYYWPMKRGGTNNSLMTDSQKCESQCSSGARLFVLRTSTDNVAGMRDLRGKPYSSLKNAFAYRKTFNPSCGCRPEPWSERAKLRHKRYAAVGKERKQLALRAIRMDLRSTLKPASFVVGGGKPAVSTPATGGVDIAYRYHDPVLPVRKPDVALQPGPVARSGRDGDVRPNVVSQADGDAGRGTGNGEQAAIVPDATSKPAVRVLNVRTFPSARQASSSRAARRPQSLVHSSTTRPLVQSLLVPGGLALRSRLN